MGIFVGVDRLGLWKVDGHLENHKRGRPWFFVVGECWEQRHLGNEVLLEVLLRNFLFCSHVVIYMELEQ